VVAETADIYDLEKGHEAFQDVVNAGDLEAVVSAYEADAIFVVNPGQIAIGRDEIRKAFAGLMELKPTLELKVKSLHQVGDIALAIYELSLEGKDPEGNSVNLEGHAAVVLRRQPDGRWLLVIDNASPFE
jgi:uncharacterized protein (TIGR02246 family)